MASNSNSDAYPSSFEGVSAVAVTSTETLNFYNCSPFTISSGGTSYFDSDFIPMGSVSDTGQYGVYLTPVNIPVSVKVGDTGSISTKQSYTDSSKSVLDGRSELGYVVEADTADTAIRLMTRVAHC